MVHPLPPSVPRRHPPVSNSMRSKRDSTGANDVIAHEKNSLPNWFLCFGSTDNNKWDFVFKEELRMQLKWDICWGLFLSLVVTVVRWDKWVRKLVMRMSGERLRHLGVVVWEISGRVGVWVAGKMRLKTNKGELEFLKRTIWKQKV